MDKVEWIQMRAITHDKTALIPLLERYMLRRHLFIDRRVTECFPLDPIYLWLYLLSVHKRITHPMFQAKENMLTCKLLLDLLLVYVLQVAKLKLVFMLSFL